MLLLDKKIGRLEAVIEKHVTHGPSFIAWERPNPNEFILDIGKISCSFTVLESKTRQEQARPLYTHAAFILVLVFILTCVTAAGPLRAALEPIYGWLAQTTAI